MPAGPLMLCLSLLHFGQPAGLPDAAAVESVALKSRMSIRTAQLTVRRFSENLDKQGAIGKAEARIWMDGDRLRTDHIIHQPNIGDQTGRRYIECFHCERRDHHLMYPEVDNVAARLVPLAPGVRFQPVHPTIDPRLLGYCVDDYGLLWHDRIDSYIGRAGRSDLRLTQEKLNGVDCQVVRYSVLEGAAQFAIWFDPARGYHPIKILHTEHAKTDEDGFRRAVLVDPQPVGRGLWFPRSIVFTKHWDGKLYYRETLDITDIRINEPISPETFMIKGMGIGDGVHFDITSEPVTRRSWVWRGGKLLTYDEDNKQLAAQGRLVEPEPVPLVAPSHPRYWLYAVAGVLVVAGTVFLWRAVRKRSA